MRRPIRFCKNCGAPIKEKQYGRFKQQNNLFCCRDCYMIWKRKNPNKKAYRGIVIISGYLYVYMPSHPFAIKKGRYVALHRLIAEWKSKRRLTAQEIVHHKDGNPLNNAPSNIEIMTISEHNKHTSSKRSRTQGGNYA